MSRRRQFGLFEIDLDSGELRHQGIKVKLQEQPFQLLAALVARPGEVVTRESLRERLWPGDTSVDFDHGLNTAIRKLRRALDDSADNPRFIETLSKHGYRFIAPVADCDNAECDNAVAAPEATSGDAHDAPASHLRWTRWTAMAAAVLSLLAVLWLTQGLSVDRWFTGSTSWSTAADLAVLPIRVLEDGDLDGGVGIRIADAVITQLANVRSLKLRPTAAILRYENKSDPVKAARELDVTHVLDGTLRKSADGYRLTVQLIRRDDGVAVWGRSYEIAGDGARLDREDLLARQLARGLAAGFPSPNGRHVQHTSGADAHELYSQGKTLLLNYSEANIRAAIETFEEALRIEPRNTLVRSELSIGLAWFSKRYTRKSEAAEWGRRANVEASLALAQDPALPEAHLARAYAASTLHGGGVNWPLVLTEADTALALDPALAQAHVARAEAFYHFGLFDLAEAELRAAFGLEPRPSVERERIGLAAALFSGRFGQVSGEAEKLRARTDAPIVTTHLGTALFYLGKRERAQTILSAIGSEDVPDGRSQAALGAFLAANGQHAEAREIVSRLAAGPHVDHHVAYSLGVTLAQLGETDAAIQWLRRSADEGFPCYPWFRDDSLLTPIRRDAAFRALLDDLRVRFEEMRSRYTRSVSGPT